MTWIQRYRIRRYFNDSVWILPSTGVIVAMATVWLVRWLDLAMGWKSALSPESARTILVTLASSMFTFVVFLSSALLIALQLASVQLTPRIIPIIFRDLIIRLALTLFVFSFTFTIAAVVRITDVVPRLMTQLAVYSFVVGMVVFFYMLDRVGRGLRPSEVLRSVARLGRSVINDVYPHSLSKAAAPPALPRVIDGEQTATIPARRDGVLLACDVPGIVARARRAGCVLELVPQIGDFVAAGSPLFQVFGDGSRLQAEEVSQTVVIGHERSIEQDPAFAFRIIVDIACKALSPAINDPTTAVLALDQLEHLLRIVGRRQLDDDRIRDGTGRVRLLHRTPGWDDFVRLAITEIRHYGHDSIQVTRRMRGMLEDLITVLPDERGAQLRRELELVQRSIGRAFEEPEDRAMATISDSQGMGGRSSQDDVAGASAVAAAAPLAAISQETQH